MSGNDGNIIVHLANSERLINPNLILCDVCKETKLVLSYIHVGCVAQKNHLTCPSCKKSNRTKKDTMRYIKRIIPTLHHKERTKNKRQLRNMISAWKKTPSLYLLVDN